MKARDRLVMSLEKTVNVDPEVIEAVVDALVLHIPVLAEYLADTGLEVARRIPSRSVTNGSFPSI